MVRSPDIRHPGGSDHAHPLCRRSRGRPTAGPFRCLPHPRRPPDTGLTCLGRPRREHRGIHPHRGWGRQASMDNGTPDTGQRRAGSGRRRSWVALTAIQVVALLALLVTPSAVVAADPAPTPTVVTDKADYAPGDSVTLSGASWAAGEAVHIVVADPAGLTPAQDVTADELGAFTAQSFTLPADFAAAWEVTATGASGATATATISPTPPPPPPSTRRPRRPPTRPRHRSIRRRHLSSRRRRRRQSRPRRLPRVRPSRS